MVSGLYSTATLLAGLLLFLVGRLADKYGKKKIIIIVAILLGASCIWNSFITSLWMFFIGVFVGRFTGQGSMTLLPSTVIPQWFYKKRAFAFSVMSIGSVIGSAVTPPINNWLINVWGWNQVWWFWALLLILVFIPVASLFLYDHPKELGLHIDNQNCDTVGTECLDEEKITASYTIQEALHTRTFWSMNFCQMLIPMITTGVVFHFVSILGIKGLSSTTAAFVLSILAIISFPATFAAGYLLDKIKMHHATAFMCFMQFLSLFILLFLNSSIGAVIFAAIQGMAMALQAVCNGVIWPNYFGTKHLGSIRGLVMTVTVIGSAIGPIPFGLAFDTHGSYTFAIILMMACSLAGVFVAFLSTKPIKSA